MVELLLKHLVELREFERQRLLWLKLSGIVFIVILLIVTDYLFFSTNSLYWTLVPIGLVLTAVWWYWTMKIVRMVLCHRTTEIEVLKEIYQDIQQFKQDIKNLNNDS